MNPFRSVQAACTTFAGRLFTIYPEAIMSPYEIHPHTADIRLHENDDRVQFIAEEAHLAYQEVNLVVCTGYIAGVARLTSMAVVKG
jgi:hypothetical protein